MKRPHRHARIALALAAVAGLGLAGGSAPTPAHAARVAVNVADAAGAPASNVAVILIVESPSAARPAPAGPPVQIVQREMKFVPALTVITPGTVVRFVNLDAWDHHVRGTEGASFEFRIGASAAPGREAGARGRPATSAAAVPASGPAAATPPAHEIVIQGATGPVRLGCHLHSRMSGDIYISESPHHAVTDEQGVARFAAVPDGLYRVVTWHPRQVIDQAPQRVTVAGEAMQFNGALNFTVPRRR